MDLTRAEFCCFNLKSRIELLNKDGAFLAERKVCDSYLVKLYRIYTFYVEVITKLSKSAIIRLDPVINLSMLSLYTADTPVGWKEKIKMEVVEIAQKEQKIKIALVDDHSLFRQGLRLLLSNFDELDIIYEASDGEELIDQLEIDTPDIIFMDINMPVMNGLTTTQKLKTLFPQIKIVVMTMYNEKKLLLDMIKNGASGFLYKNADSSEIYEAINRVMDKGFYFNEYLTKAVRNSWSEKNSSTQILTNNPNLESRDLQVLSLICKQYDKEEIAELLLVPLQTVESCRQRLFKTLGVDNTAGLIVYAVENGLVDQY